MSFNLSELKEKSIKFLNKLRFPIESLEIRDGNIWKNFKNLSGIYKTPRGNKFSLGLRDVLLDTGNEADYCLISAHFINDFRKNFLDLNYESKNIIGIRGNNIRILVSLEKQMFRLFEVKFYSKIGFRYDIDEDAINSVNIGINGIIQFLNIIFNISGENYYYCKNL
ncbi:MAG: hypothetical protein ACTSQJ_08365 [Promethearchaeota archaeon]